jgi:hypothetical protein
MVENRWLKLVPALVLAAVAMAAAPAHGQALTVPGDCAWPLKSNADRANIAYPDQSAQYWTSAFAGVPGTHLEIHGRFPHARYISFHAYEGSVPVDKVTDFELRPDKGTNPFLPGADRTNPGRYTLRVVPGAPPADPAQRAPNTLYAGRGNNGEPLPAATIIYRVYLGEGDQAGGVGLPEVSEVVDGQGPGSGPAALPACPPNQASASAGLNEALAGEGVPASWPGPAVAAAPTWGVARSGGSTTQAGPVSARGGNPFFPNFDNTYLSLAVTRDRGDVVALRAKAPTFTQTRGVRTTGTGQLRYWSFCTNDQYTTRFVGCVADQDAKIDAAGYVTVVVSDTAHRPAGLAPGDNWLPWGPASDVFVLYRHMLPAPDFAQAVQRVPVGADPATTMGEYYPRTVICQTAQFERDRCGLPRPAVAAPAPAAGHPRAHDRKPKHKRKRSHHRRAHHRRHS